MISYLHSLKNMTKNKSWFTLAFSWWSNHFWWHQEGRFFCWLGHVLTTTSTGTWACAFIVSVLLFLLWCTTCRPRRSGSCFAPNNAWPSPHLSQTPWPSRSVQKYIYVFFVLIKKYIYIYIYCELILIGYVYRESEERCDSKCSASFRSVGGCCEQWSAGILYQWEANWAWNSSISSHDCPLHEADQSVAHRDTCYKHRCQGPLIHLFYICSFLFLNCCQFACLNVGVRFVL